MLSRPLRPLPAREPVFDVSEMSQLMKLLSDVTRLCILRALAAGPASVTELIRQIGDLPQPTASHHLGLLRMNGLVVNHRRGKSVIYQFSPKVKADPKTIHFDIGSGVSIGR